MKWAQASVDHEEWLSRILPILKGDKSGKHMIYIKYHDATNRESRIYEIPYLQEIIKNEKMLRIEFGNLGVRFNDGTKNDPFEALDKVRRTISGLERQGHEVKERVDNIKKDVEHRSIP
jgi:hypothetical protein